MLTGSDIKCKTFPRICRCNNLAITGHQRLKKIIELAAVAPVASPSCRERGDSAARDCVHFQPDRIKGECVDFERWEKGDAPLCHSIITR